jgi:predicted ATPase/DNA-binding SARP family transcriptional activator
VPIPRNGSSHGAPGLHIELLGGFRITVGSTAIEESNWRLRKARSLVKLLALAPSHRLHREEVTDLLWPDLEPGAAGNNLRYALHVARRALADVAPGGRGYLQLQGDLLVLCPDGPLRIDVEIFEAAAAAARGTQDPSAYCAAIERYTGDLLPEDRYEDWAAERRESLRQLYVGLLLELAQLHEARGESEPAIDALRRVIAGEPAHEEAHVALVRLYAERGQHHRALRQYQQLREALRRELDTEPDPASERLYQEIRALQLPAIGMRIPAGPLASAPAGQRHNLPAFLTSFIGREREIAEIKRLLLQVRLLTLTGAGGCGKTRLALQVAGELEREYPDGVWVVELAALSDPSLVPQAVASGLGLGEAPGQPLTATIAESLRCKQLLLVLDNCEHLVEACATLADALLGACPNLRVLATSRQPLGLVGEAVWPVPPLSLPAVGRLPPTEHLVESEAIRLFLERARLTRPDFALTSQNATAVAQVCQRLDGMPLAIELAAARVKLLSAEQIAARLDDRFRLLSGGSRTAPRHQTLRAAMDWSYALLSQAERTLFNRLAVFAGGWTIEAAETVNDGDVLDLLSSLVDKSLVLAEPDRTGVGRYRLLETLRQYGRERLANSGEAEQIQRRHTAFVVTLAEQAETELLGPEQAAWLVRLEREQENVRAALASARVRGDAEAALRLAGALWFFWLQRGYWSEGRDRLEEALALARDAGCSKERAKALCGAGTLAWLQDDYGAARSRLEESVALWRQLGNRRGLALALYYLGHAALMSGDYPAARSCYEQSLPIFQEEGDTWGLSQPLEGLGRVALQEGDYTAARARLEESLAIRREIGDNWQIALALNALGDVARCQGDDELATALYEESLALFRELDSRGGMASSLHNLGYVAHGQGDERRARALFGESLALFRELGDRRGIAEALAGLAGVATATGQPERAARLFGAAEALLAAIGVQLWPSNRADYDRDLAAARGRLDEASFMAAWAQGRAMSIDRAVGCALEPVLAVGQRRSTGR